MHLTFSELKQSHSKSFIYRFIRIKTTFFSMDNNLTYSEDHQIIFNMFDPVPFAFVFSQMTSYFIFHMLKSKAELMIPSIMWNFISSPSLISEEQYYYTVLEWELVA